MSHSFQITAEAEDSLVWSLRCGRRLQRQTANRLTPFGDQAWQIGDVAGYASSFIKT